MNFGSEPLPRSAEVGQSSADANTRFTGRPSGGLAAHCYAGGILVGAIELYELGSAEGDVPLAI